MKLGGGDAGVGKNPIILGSLHVTWGGVADNLEEGLMYLRVVPAGPKYTWHIGGGYAK